jgi:2,6-dihydroxypyridine 3-monooxygenase
MTKKRYRIAIVGGSIAGCSAAIALGLDGHDVRIFERSSQKLQDRGAGIVIPAPLFESLKAQQWLDKDTPHTPLSGMSYRVKDASNAENGRSIWHRPLDAVAMRWGHLFAQLRKRVSDQDYINGIDVLNITPNEENGQTLTLNDGSIYHADIVIAADGIHSRTRDLVNGPTNINYSGYVLWRGLLDQASKPSSHTTTPQNDVLWHPYSGGMAGCYIIPASDHTTSTENHTLNWGIYDKVDTDILSKLLPDAKSPEASSAHSLNDFAKEHLLNLLNNIPAFSASLFRQTSAPFVQAIVDLDSKKLVTSNIALIGDAAAVLRPHTASGAVKAIENAISLTQAFQNTSPSNSDNLKNWQQQELPKLRQQVTLSKALGEGLVTSAPIWTDMSETEMNHWWQSMLEGKNWYMK